MEEKKDPLKEISGSTMNENQINENKYYPGLKINKLTLIEIDHKQKEGFRIYWKCKCDCGNITIKRQDMIKYRKSCGCRNTKDLTNKRFNRVVVIKCVGRKSGKSLWECKCDCGNIVQLTSRQLLSGTTTSCGCMSHLKGKDSLIYKGYEELSSHRWSKIKYSAKIRNIEFSIDMKYAWELLIKQNKECALSGRPIELYSDRNKETTASLDRIDSNQGYIKGNVQWVHKDINKIKRDYDENYFLYLCNKIYSKNCHKIKPKAKPDWVDYFLELAKYISIRSIDAETQHGCVITDRDNHILGTGYNSMPFDIPEELCPNMREEKYAFMIHAEINAIINCGRSPWTVSNGCIAYITGPPCFNCLKIIWNSNVTTVYYKEGYSCAYYNNDEKDMVDFLVQATGLEYIAVHDLK